MRIRKGGENKERYLRRRQCGKERGRAGKRRNQILEDHPSSLFGKLYQGDYLCIRGWWKKGEGSELGHRAKAERKLKKKKATKIRNDMGAYELGKLELYKF